MDFFKLFELPISLKVDKEIILKKYYLLCKQYHPDNFSNLQKQEQSLKMTAHINEAKNVLEDSYKRLAYLLTKEKIITTEEKYQLPAQFLNEMMEINEEIMDLENESGNEKKNGINNKIIELEKALYLKVKNIHDQDLLILNETNSNILKEYYYKKKYIHRILEKL